ncbi:MAG: LacI family DNA-binding transcriptional regulator [Opitutaceae bacterium]|jgi:DNA-binding LacI/PurR family transcriptional regulator
MASLAEISRICGVSLGATSKALSGKPGVSEATRQRILSVAAQHNYRPNRLVHAIQSGRSMTVGLTCNDFRDDFSGRIIEGMLEVLYGADYDAIVISWDLCVHEGEKALRTFAERRVDGLLMFPPADQPSQAYLHELKSFHRPIVVVDQTFAGVKDYDFVGSQDFEGGALAAEHLIGLGHHNIANLFHQKTSTGRARLEGFRSAMQRHGLALHDQWMREIENYGTAEPYDHARALLGGANPPSAIVAFNDWVALDVLAAAHDLGLSVPRDVSVVGFADLKLASVVRPRLTTITQDPLAIGRRAAGRLLELLNAGMTASPQTSPVMDRVPVKLQTGESSRALD